MAGIRQPQEDAMRSAERKRLDRLATTPDGVCRYCVSGR